ncbi:conserved hypothetical protein [Tenacibaculum maritimum]|uniref:hypothetical protein n=1 Tax=Tenacibaculum maritimum TaxID=107401 RepID=UPI0012E454FC|nr:hypothetical protein [Tenacibaculum maritimum]CAA0163287.1 conserved hypothetical protein [Tenacibaculum maritimum]CAA0173356.1 conserved hypothetical protein [Tenacibaculum maritimum]
MTIEEYREKVREIIEKTDLLPGFFSDIEGLDNEEDFLDAFKFYTETLELNKDYGIEPAHLFFINSDKINGRATLTSNGHFLIGINRGTIDWLVNKFKLNDTLISDSGVNLFNILSTYMDTSINKLMYQAGCHFTFYHELAHLIQKSNYLELSMEENPKAVENFNMDRHLLEIDADTFSALCIGTHIIQYSENIFGENISRPIMEAIQVLFIIPIILYILSFEGNKQKLYFREKTHPHPAIRITNFIIVLTHYINGALEGKNRGFTTNQGRIFIYAMEIAEELQDSFFDTSVITSYRENVTANRPQVIKYIGDLVESNAILTTTAQYKWNIRNT